MHYGQDQDVVIPFRAHDDMRFNGVSQEFFEDGDRLQNPWFCLDKAEESIKRLKILRSLSHAPFANSV